MGRGRWPPGAGGAGVLLAALAGATGLARAAAAAAAAAGGGGEPGFSSLGAPLPGGVPSPDEAPLEPLPLGGGGPLGFAGGFPDTGTAEDAYDALDLSRAVTAYMDFIPAASASALASAMQSLADGERGGGGAQHVSPVAITDSLMHAHPLFLTANTDTVYAIASVDLSAGPVVIEVPPDSGPGLVNDLYFRYVLDMGSTVSSLPTSPSSAASLIPSPPPSPPNLFPALGEEESRAWFQVADTMGGRRGQTGERARSTSCSLLLQVIWMVRTILLTEM